jgi:predicted transposase YdaD
MNLVLAVSYDNTSKFLFSQYPNSFTQWLFGDSSEFTVLKPTELNLEPIRADGVLFLEGTNLIGHVEFQTEPDVKMPYRMTNYYIRLRYFYPLETIRQVVIYLCKTESERVYQDFYQTPEMFHQFQVIRLWEQDPEIFFTLPGLLPYAVLADNGDDEATLRRVAVAIDEVVDSQQRSDLTAASSILASLKLDETLIRNIFRSEIMMQSVIYRDMLESSRLQAEAEAQVRAEARERLLVQNLLVQRLGEIPANLMQRIDGLDIDRVETLGLAMQGFDDLQDLNSWLGSN